MRLPDYFLADLPPEAALTPALVTDACLALKANRQLYLAERSSAELVGVLSALAQNWLDPTDSFRRLALEADPAATGFPPEVLAAGLDAFFEALSSEALEALILQDLGQLAQLDRLTPVELPGLSPRLAMARGPALLVHVAAGNLPAPALSSLVLGLLVRSAQFMKCASGSSLLPRLFAHSLHEVEPKLGACLEIAEWPGGTAALDGALLAQADCVTATGEDATLSALRAQLPVGVRFLSYGHRVSFGYVAQESLNPHGLPKTVAAAAQDVVAWNQRGCLSPQVFYVETGGRNSPEQFAQALATELEACERTQPRGPVSLEAAAAIATRRTFYEVRAAHSCDTCLWSSPGSTAWTVVYENEPRFMPSCANRFIYVKAVPDLEHALKGAEAIQAIVTTVGLAAQGQKAQELAWRLARWGVPRICPLGRMQKPPLTWRHDGRPSLGDLVTWSDWER
ncbi:MAG: hypothetical protein FJ387_23840 [Verrucomicrobia bacterium]|nr:hypothetical protein [Verrucomicrobiota bacterium]